MKRKRLIIVLLLLIGLTGCALGSSPKSRVENLLNKYQMNSSDIKSELDDFLNTLSIDTDYKEDYRKVYEKQYSDLKYKIKAAGLYLFLIKQSPQSIIFIYFNLFPLCGVLLPYNSF